MQPSELELVFVDRMNKRVKVASICNSRFGTLSPAKQACRYRESGLSNQQIKHGLVISNRACLLQGGELLNNTLFIVI